jgi:hypothetical protein
VLAKFGRRLAKDALEHAIELGERLETDIVGNFTNPPVGVQELGPRIFQPDMRNVVGEFETGCFPENFQK